MGNNDSNLTLVTGATGLVGNNVTRMLLARGTPVRSLVRSGKPGRALSGLDVEIIQGDIRDPDAVRRACQNVGQVIHAAGYVQIGNTGLDLHRAINVEGTRHVANCCREFSIRMVHVSSCDALGICSLDQPVDEETLPADSFRVPYVISKREAEVVLLDQVDRGLDAVIVNPSFMLGPWDWKPSSGRMLLAVARGGAWVTPRGWFNLCDVRDVATGILAALKTGQTGRRYILAGLTMSYLEAWCLFADVTGARRPLSKAGPAMLWLAGKFGDLKARITGQEGDVNSGAIKLASLPKHYSSARAEAELGYRNRPMRESVEDAWDWFQENGFA